MSTFEQFQKYDLNLMNGQTNVRMTLLDGMSKVMYKGYDDTQLTLPKGLYTLRSELDGQILEKTIKLDSNQTVETQVPQFFSAAPIAGAANTHDYYRDNALKYSMQHTAARLQGDQPVNSSILVFIRAVDESTYGGEELGAGFSILGAAREELCTFQDRSIVAKDLTSGWLAFSAPASHGMYYLKYGGERAREIPIYLFAGWQSQVFITFYRQPLLGSTRIFMARPGRGFKWDEQVLSTVDSAVLALQNNKYTIPDWLSNSLLGGKFENPMMGIIGAYFLLKNKETANVDDILLAATVLRNLEYLLDGEVNSPDLKVLRFMYGDLTHEQLASDPFTEPPMVLAGLKYIVEQSFTYPNIIQEGSVIDLVAPYVCTDLAWASWSKQTDGQSLVNVLAGSAIERLKDGGLKNWFKSLLGRSSLARQFRVDSSEQKVALPTNGQGARVLLQLLYVITTYIKSDESEDVKKEMLTYQYIARQFGVPPVTVKRIVNEVRSRSLTDRNLNGVVAMLLKKLVSEKNAQAVSATKVLETLNKIGT